MDKVQHDSETPARGQQVISAVAFIYQEFDGEIKVFLPKRADTKKFLPGIYELPGGHIDFGEAIEAGLKREIMEEFGLEVALGDPFAAFTYTNEIKGSHSVEVVYFAQFKDADPEITLHPDDHSTYTWAAEADLPQIFTGTKSLEDDEVKAIRRGFVLLKNPGNPLK